VQLSADDAGIYMYCLEYGQRWADGWQCWRSEFGHFAA